LNTSTLISDTESFKAALRRVLRQDPDIVLIGEMRDLETVEAALTVSETGHLTFATLHTNTAVQSINRIIDVFPPHQQEQVRVQLSFVLECIISQQLIPKRSGAGRVLSSEVLVPNAAIRNLIREDKVHQIYAMMQTGQSKFGMQTMNQSLFNLYTKGLISYEDTIGKSPVTDELIDMIQKAASQKAARTTVRR
jgi:twitching motility protein PilT